MSASTYRMYLIVCVTGLLLGFNLRELGGVDGVTSVGDGESTRAAAHRNIGAVLKARWGADVADPERDVVWLDEPAGGVGTLDAMVTFTFVALATMPGRPGRDLFRLEVKVAPNGRVFDDAWVVRLTDSYFADEADLAFHGTRIVNTVRDRGIITAIEVRDLAGENPDRVGTAGFGRFDRIANGITNLGETGSARGIDYERYSMDGFRCDAHGDQTPEMCTENDDGIKVDTETPIPKSLVLSLEESHMALRDTTSGREMARIDLASGQSSGQLVLTRSPTVEKMPKDFLIYLSDWERVYTSQNLAPAWLEWGFVQLKNVYFDYSQWKAAREEEEVVDEPQVAESPKVVEAAVQRARFQAEQSSFAWPPPPVEPMLDGRLKGEGMWTQVSSDNVQYQSNAPPPFYKTALRPSKRYKKKWIHVMAWDPEQISLNMRAGTSNPVPQTGNRGDGRIPRKRKVIERVVGGFNGGFQTADIWYGMMVDKKVLLRPRSYGATVGTWADGRTAFGTWKPGAPIPDELMSYRQNLPPLIEDGLFNPYRRRTWGWHRNIAGAVNGWTVRSALCYTYEGYVMYFWTEFANEHALASTMFHFNCRYAIHLDMNRGHSGFELYRQLAADQKPRDKDSVHKVTGLRLQGTVPTPRMRHMRHPIRYLKVDYRDFFYLTMRDVLPGADLKPLHAGAVVQGEGKWRLSGLPYNAEFPPRLAASTLSPSTGASPNNDAGLQVLQLDLRGLGVQRHRMTNSAGARIKLKADLAVTLPLAAVAKPTARIGLKAHQIEGYALADAPKEPVSRALVLGKSRKHFAIAVLVRNAPISDAAAVLRTRDVKEAVWIPLGTGGEIRFYQPVKGGNGAPGLLEMLFGKTDGIVVSDLEITGNIDRLAFTKLDRLARIVRLFPELRPKERRARPKRRQKRRRVK